MFNTNTIVHLLDYFVNTVNIGGQNSASVESYRKSIDNLVAKGQILKSEWYMTMYIIGMMNTDNVKWESTMQKIEQYKLVVSQILPSDNIEKIEQILKIAKENMKVSTSVLSALNITYMPNGQGKIIEIYQDKKKSKDKTTKKSTTSNLPHSYDSSYYSYNGCGSGGRYSYSSIC